MPYRSKLQLVNQKFGYLLVLAKDSEKTKQTKKTHWYCKCDCGNYCSIIYGHLKTGNSKSCGCRRATNTRSGKWTGYKHITGSHWNNIKKDAKKRDIKVEITIQEASDLLEKQNFKCALTGETLIMAATHKEYLQGLRTASLDRIDSNKDYSLDNIRWIHKEINLMKLDYNDEEFIKWCTKVSNNFPEDLIKGN